MEAMEPPTVSASNGTFLGRDVKAVSAKPCGGVRTASGSSWQTTATSLNGVDHAVALTCSLFVDGTGEIEFPLNQQYDRLEVDIGLADSTLATPDQVVFDFIGDARFVLIEPTAVTLGEVVPISVDVSSVTRLTLRVTGQGAGGSNESPMIPAWASPRLLPG